MMLCTEMKIQCSLYPARLSRTYTHTQIETQTRKYVRTKERKNLHAHTHTLDEELLRKFFFSIQNFLFILMKSTFFSEFIYAQSTRIQWYKNRSDFKEKRAVSKKIRLK